eukprot:2906350-Rhodomonas_salina.2
MSRSDSWCPRFQLVPHQRAPHAARAGPDPAIALCKCILATVSNCPRPQTQRRPNNKTHIRAHNAHVEKTTHCRGARA